MSEKNLSQKPILHLNVKSKWFEMIASGEKTEEYRLIKPFWNRIFSCYIKIKGKFYHPTDIVICFSNGFQKDRKQIFLECTGLFVREGKEEWGAIPGEQHYVLKLGKVIKKAAN
jgi:hypothetical protein